MVMRQCHFCDCPEGILISKGTPMIGWLTDRVRNGQKVIVYFDYAETGRTVPHPLSRDYILCEEHKAMVKFA